MEKFPLVFDSVILKQLKKEARNNVVREMLSKMLNKLELAGPYAGKLLDSKLNLYEIKNMHPPLRLYYKLNEKTNEILVFEFEMKTSQKKQNRTIVKLKKKISEA